MKTTTLLASLLSLSTLGACGGAPGPERPPALANAKLDSANGWMHNDLTADDGSTIALDYKFKTYEYSSDKPTEYYYYDPLWVTVTSSKLTSSSAARVILVNKTHTDGECGLSGHDDQTVFRLDLQAEPEGWFSGEVNSQGSFINGSGNWNSISSTPEDVGRVYSNIEGYCTPTTRTLEQISIVIDGQWLRDPISQSNNFTAQFDLAR